MQHLTLFIISEEFRVDDPADTEARAAFRVCEKLRRSLSVLTGVMGFRSVLARALVLAKAEAPWLGELKLGLDGALAMTDELEARVGPEEAIRGSVILIRSLLGLLVIFIGERLTVRLLQDVWPKAVQKSSQSGKKLSHEEKN